MTYNVLGGTLNLAQSINALNIFFQIFTWQLTFTEIGSCGICWRASKPNALAPTDLVSRSYRARTCVSVSAATRRDDKHSLLVLFTRLDLPAIITCNGHAGTSPTRKLPD